MERSRKKAKSQSQGDVAALFRLGEKGSREKKGSQQLGSPHSLSHKRAASRDITWPAEVAALQALFNHIGLAQTYESLPLATACQKTQHIDIHIKHRQARMTYDQSVSSRKPRCEVHVAFMWPFYRRAVHSSTAVPSPSPDMEFLCLHTLLRQFPARSPWTCCPHHCTNKIRPISINTRLLASAVRSSTHTFTREHYGAEEGL